MQQTRLIQQDNKLLIEPVASTILAILCSKCPACEETFKFLSLLKKQTNQINIYHIFIERDPVAQVHLGSSHPKIYGFKNQKLVSEFKKSLSSQNIHQFWVDLVGQQTLPTTKKVQIQPKSSDSSNSSYKIFHP